MTELLREKFLDLKTWVDQSKIISNQNNQVVVLLSDKYLKLLDNLKAELVASEKGVIEAVYDSLHLRDGRKGLDEEEFGLFVARLPEGYKERFKFELGAFRQLAGNDGIFDRRELDIYLNKFAEEQVLRAKEGNVVTVSDGDDRGGDNEGV